MSRYRHKAGPRDRKMFKLSAMKINKRNLPLKMKRGGETF